MDNAVRAAALGCLLAAALPSAAQDNGQVKKEDVKTWTTTIDGKEYILETAIKPDYGFVRAMKADEAGNLTGVGSTLNFHPTIAAASRITIAEVDEIVPMGAISPDDVKIPGIYVDRIVIHDASQDEADRALEVLKAAQPA